MVQKHSAPPSHADAHGHVLVVDDDADTRESVRCALGQSEVRSVCVSTGEQALQHLRAHGDSTEAIVLDVQMPGMSGFEVVRRLKSRHATAAIPVLMLTGSDVRDDAAVGGIEGGALDYILKPCSLPLLVAKVEAACKRARAEKQLRRQLRVALRRAALDPLTRLCNRRAFEARLRESTAHARRTGEPFTLVMLDLDHFKRVNDRWGHGEGDETLRRFADALRTVLRADDVAFRYAGDEFVVLLRGCGAALAVDVLQRLRRHLHAHPYKRADGAARATTFSAGVAAATADFGFDADDVVARADAATYRAKTRGRDRIECG